MAESRDADLGANALANAFQINRERGALGPGYFAPDGILFTPGMYRKSGLMLRRMVHHKPYLNDETKKYLRDFYCEVSAAIDAGLRDKASDAFAIIGRPLRPVQIWNARTFDWMWNPKNIKLRLYVPWENIAEYLADREGDIR